jgi:dipeptidyl aminopeptidase/acylaminoacyl peptidase
MVSDPQISPDGKSIVIVVSRRNFEDDINDVELVLVDVTTGAQRILTVGRKQPSFPRWSPSGDRLAFLSVVPYTKENKDDTTQRDDSLQVFIMPMIGGDAKKITNAPNGIQQFAWQPDGKRIAYVTSDDPPNQKAINSHNDSFEIGDNDYLETSATTSSHLWLVSAEGGTTKRLTSGSWSLANSTPPSAPSSPLSWTPDGKSLVITRQERPYSGDSDLTTLQILNVQTGELRKLTHHETLEGYGVVSPDGSKVAYWYPRDGDYENVNDIFVAPVAGGNGSDLTLRIDRNLQRALWMPDGQSLLVSGDDGTEVAMWVQPLEGTAHKLPLGDVVPNWFFWVDMTIGPKGEIAFAGSTASQPSELYYKASPKDLPKRLTNFNKEIADLELGKLNRFEWQGPDGFREDGILVYPPDFKSDKKYPLVLYIHGGPNMSSTTAFSSLPLLIADHGYVVFEPNYRGSDNLGTAYEHAVFNDAGNGPGRDVMSGIEAVKKLGFVDESKIAVSGWSYGGYMTTWLIGHYQIWKTAIAGAAVTDWNEDYNLSDIGLLFRYGFKGSPWLGYRDDYVAQSPITSASRIRTPTLILNDTGDSRVPITQSYQLYHALKDQGVPVKFVAYPIPGHSPGDPVRLEDLDRRWLDWLDQYLK